jgi:predicted transcriptional regulator
VPVDESFFNRSVKEFMRKKFYIVMGEQSVADAAELMKKNNLGSLGVDLGGGQLGILTDRDIVMKVVAEMKDPLKTKLKDVATLHPVTVNENASLEECLRLMRDHGILRLIVVDSKGKPVGLLVERWVFLSFVNELVGARHAEPQAQSWMDRYIHDVTDAALREYD